MIPLVRMQDRKRDQAQAPKEPSHIGILLFDSAKGGFGVWPCVRSGNDQHQSVNSHDLPSGIPEIVRRIQCAGGIREPERWCEMRCGLK